MYDVPGDPPAAYVCGTVPSVEPLSFEVTEVAITGMEVADRTEVAVKPFKNYGGSF